MQMDGLATCQHRQAGQLLFQAHRIRRRQGKFEFDFFWPAHRGSFFHGIQIASIEGSKSDRLEITARRSGLTQPGLWAVPEFTFKEIASMASISLVKVCCKTGQITALPCTCCKKPSLNRSQTFASLNALEHRRRQTAPRRSRRRPVRLSRRATAGRPARLAAISSTPPAHCPCRHRA